MDEQTVLSYKNFRNLSADVIELAKEIMPDKVIYINYLNDKIQLTMRVSKNNTNVNVNEGDIIPVEEAVCNQIDYKNNKPMLLENIRENNFDEKVNKTIKKSNMGSYLGIPIILKNGMRFGALCAAHHDQRDFDEKDVHLLRNLAKLFSYYLDLEDIAYKDTLTGLNNTQYLKNFHDDIVRNGGILLMLDLDCFKSVNDNFGHYVGDEILKELGKKLLEKKKQFKESYVFRIGGDEFLIYIKDELKLIEIDIFLNSLVKKLANWDTPIGDIKLSSSVGAIKIKPNCETEFLHLIKKVDQLLYKAKNNGKNTYVFEFFI